MERFSLSRHRTWTCQCDHGARKSSDLPLGSDTPSNCGRSVQPGRVIGTYDTSLHRRAAPTNAPRRPSYRPGPVSPYYSSTRCSIFAHLVSARLTTSTQSLVITALMLVTPCRCPRWIAAQLARRLLPRLPMSLPSAPSPILPTSKSLCPRFPPRALPALTIKVAEGLLVIGTDGLLDVCNLVRCETKIVHEVATQPTFHLVDLFTLEHSLSHKTL
jgi:hypothetical protein